MKENNAGTTNADVIRSMNDSQLVKFLDAIAAGDIDYSITFCDKCADYRRSGEPGNMKNFDCDDCFREWVLGDANDYNGLLSKGLNSGYVEVQNNESTT